MRYIRYLFLLVLGIILLELALANREPVTLKLFTDEIESFAGYAPVITLPLFIIVFGGIVSGLLIGFVWEWLREHKHRAVAASERRERVRLQQEVGRLKGPDPRTGDDIIAIVDEGKGAR